MATKDAVGRYGENVAAGRLSDAGWRILARNWRASRGELDIVAAEGDCLVVVEVKTRRSDRAGSAFEAVTPHKVARLRALTSQWLASQSHSWPHVRIDIMAVMPQRQGGAVVEHLRGVG